MLSARLADLAEDVGHMRLDHTNAVSALEAGWADERQDLLERLKITQHELVQARCFAVPPSSLFLSPRSLSSLYTHVAHTHACMNTLVHAKARAYMSAS